MMLRKNETGFVSLFTCIMISLLLLVVTMSLITLEALQLRKAEDSEQTLRAYYTAEAGVEDAVSKVLTQAIKTGIGDNTCNARTGYDVPGLAGWTCQWVSFSGTPFGKLDSPDLAKTVDPGNMSATPYGSVVIQWNQSTNANPAYYNMPATLPDQATGATYAAPIELSIVEYPLGGFKSSEVCDAGVIGPGCKVKLQNVLILPGGGGGGPAAIPYNTSGGFKTGSPYLGNCTPLPHNLPGGYANGASDFYNCHAVIRNLDSVNYGYIFRIRSKYTASSYRMIFKDNSNGTGNPVTVPDGTATIDVTARAGQTYRRVISKLPLSGAASGRLNYVIYSDTDICKNFDVLVNSARPGCPY